MAILVVWVLPSAAQLHEPLSITGQDVATAMAVAGWKVDAANVKFLSQVSVIGQNGRLKVIEVAPWVENSLKVKLRCLDPRACLPFYVLVNRTAGGPESLPSLANSAEGTRVELTGQRPVLRSGDPATMVFNNRFLHISMPVICLQSGRQGQTIRVASIDHRRFYKAEIMGPGLLKAVTL